MAEPGTPTGSGASTPTTLAAAEQERERLYNTFKDALSALIDEATQLKSVGEGNEKLTALTDALESIIQHGFRGKKVWLRQTTDPWPFIDGALKAAAQAANPAAAGADSLAATVAAMTEDAPEARTRKYILMALMQQTLGDHVKLLATSPDLPQWFDVAATMRTPDRIMPIAELLRGLTQLEFNFYLREETPDQGKLRKRLSMSQMLLGKSEEVIKSGLAATWTTLGTVKSRVEAARSMLDPKLKSSDLAAAEETIARLVADQHELNQRLEEMSSKFELERRSRLATEVELVSVKMARDKEQLRLRRELGKLESQLSVFRQSPTELQEKLLKAIEEQHDLREQLERAKLVARLAKEKLDRSGIGSADLDAADEPTANGNGAAPANADTA
ncbi:Protein rufy3 [Polyrhizophydium stewartii]|uniref:Protein rufy3 n=1 Tax=Polyrhizophydium stewartii TaxID=2732419 RepID=A0ABR4NH01_9FUNG|nr:hypothetical protein HK105_005565 [Polyrhizophydium stewartii]